MREELGKTFDESTMEVSGDQKTFTLNDMDHLNRILREKTQENLFLGTWNFD
jgi:hypothetical protein